MGRPRLVLLAPLVASAAIALGTGTAQSQPSPSRRPPVVGRVDAAGVLQPPAPGWSVTHPDPGVYRVRLPADDLVLDVKHWDAAADVTILPQGGGVTEVRFSHPGGGVDTAFDFLGVAEP